MTAEQLRYAQYQHLRRRTLLNRYYYAQQLKLSIARIQQLIRQGINPADDPAVHDEYFRLVNEGIIEEYIVPDGVEYQDFNTFITSENIDDVKQ